MLSLLRSPDFWVSAAATLSIAAGVIALKQWLRTVGRREKEHGSNHS